MNGGNALELIEIARALVAPGRGILAADESTSTIEQRFNSIGVVSTEEARREYRQILFTAPAAENWISGVILYDETIRQSTADGTPFPQLLTDRGMLPGIKVDLGTKPLPAAKGETITEGLDGLHERLAEYRSLGARFAKWRATIFIGEGKPSDYAIQTNAHALARYAALCQESGLVPIVEPEVLMHGDHSIADSFDATFSTLRAVYGQLQHQRVLLEGTILKPNMVLAGYQAPEQPSDDEIANKTLTCLRRTVPPAIAGIVFLSGGQSDEAATSRLNALNRTGGSPWPLSFSYGRALQTSALHAWSGDAHNQDVAQRAFVHRARLNGEAQKGTYSEDMESVAA